MNGIEEPAREVGIEFGTYAGWKLVAFLANVHIPRNEYESRVTKSRRPFGVYPNVELTPLS